MRELRGFSHENILHYEQFKLTQGLLHELVVGIGMGNVGADHVHATHIPFLDGVEHFWICHALFGRYLYPPSGGDFLLLFNIIGRLIVGITKEYRQVQQEVSYWAQAMVAL